VTVLLSRSDLEGLLDVGDCLAGLRRGFLAEPSPIAAQRVHTDLPGSRTATALIPGLVEGIPAYTVKVNAKFPGSRPALRGVVCLAALRTWDRLTVCDTDPGRARDFAARHGGTVAAVPRGAARDAGIALLATWSRTPLLDHGDVQPGTQVTSLGADEPGKAELGPALLAAGRVLVDDVPLALSMGAPGTAGLSADGIAGTLSQVLRGTVPGRTTDADVTVYTPVGLPWPDLALAWAAYQQARAAGRGLEVDLLA
jgi:ornithine cyclodeaminase